MAIKWLDEKNLAGTVTIANSSLTFSVAAMGELNHAYALKVGVDEEKKVYFSPLKKSEVLRGDVESSRVFLLVEHNSYARISNRGLVSLLEKETGLDLSKGPKKFESRFDEAMNCLVIDIRKGAVD